MFFGEKSINRILSQKDAMFGLFWADPHMINAVNE